MTSYLFPVYILLVLGAFQTLRQHVKESNFSFNGTTILLAVVGILAIDNLVITAGLPLDEGPLLAGLSLGRWWLRILLLPLLIVTYIEMAGRFEIKAAKTTTVRIVAGVLALLLVAVQAWANLPHLQLDSLAMVELIPGTSWNLYELSSEPTLPGTLASQIIGAALGLLMLVRGRWPWVLLAAGAVLIEATILPLPLFASNGLETALMWALVATESRVQREGLQLSNRELDNRLGGLG